MSEQNKKQKTRKQGPEEGGPGALGHSGLVLREGGKRWEVVGRWAGWVVDGLESVGSADGVMGWLHCCLDDQNAW